MVKRFRIESDGFLVEHARGPWCHHADVSKVVDERDRLRAELERARVAYLEKIEHCQGWTERAESAEREARELRQLLTRIVKYAREDRAATPGVTRLARALAEAEGRCEPKEGT